MKQLLLLALLVNSLSSFAQQRMNTREDYERKGRKLGTAAWILAGSGATMIAAGTIMAINTNWDELDYDDNYDGRRETGKAIGSVALIGTGVVAVIGSIPLFIISAKNKGKAASFSFRNEHYPQVYNGRIANASLPALTLRVRL